MLRKSRSGRYGVYSFGSYSIFLGNYQSQTCPNPFSIVSIRPSFTRIMRSVASATEGSCVTITIVSPSRFTFRSSSITSTVVLLSNAPVGSSARITCGLAIRGAGNGNTLFLSTGHFVRHMLRPVLQPDHIRIFQRHSVSLLATYSLVVQGQGYVLHRIFE